MKLSDFSIRWSFGEAQVLGQPGLIVRANSFPTKSLDTWKDPVHGVMAPQGAGQQNKELNCAAFSFSYLPRIPKNLKSGLCIALWPFLLDAVPRHYPAWILAQQQAFSRQNPLQGLGQYLAGDVENGR